jgi:hypothetical protein
MKRLDDIRIEVLPSTRCSYVQTEGKLRCRLELPAGRNREVASCS